MGRDHALTRFALDTNILVYGENVLRAPDDEAKVRRTRELLDEQTGLGRTAIVLPIQVLAELHYVLVRKARLVPDIAAERVRKWREPAVIVASDQSVFDQALALTSRHKVTIYDAIVLNAVVGHADILLSEDFQDGFVWRGVTVRNPFVADFG